MNSDQMKAVIVDDEQSARDILTNLLERYCPEIKIVAQCEHVIEAVKKIKQFEPDVVFLDIEMPMYSGFELVEFFETSQFEIVFVSAYDEYAVRAFNVSAVDYLLKPVSIDLLKAAVEKVKTAVQTKNEINRYRILVESLKHDRVDEIVIANRGVQQILKTNAIIAFEAQESYTRIHTQQNGSIITSKNLKHFENMLKGEEDFFRVHKSWLINMKQIVSVSYTALEVQLTNDLVAKLSKYKRSDFKQRLG